MEEPRIPLRALRPWLWLPVAAVTFVAGLASWGQVSGSGVDAGSLGSALVVAVVAAELVGSAATFWPGRGVRSWGAVGAFLVLTLAAHAVVGVLAVARGVVEGGADGLDPQGLVFTGVFFPYVVLLAFGWVTLPLGGAAGLLAWTLADRARRRVTAGRLEPDAS